MAKVRITRREAERGLLPPVCALTGVPTDDVKRKSFLWQPSWIGVLVLIAIPVYIIVSLVMRKTMVVNVPLVKEKHGHWMWRTLVGVGGVLLSIALLVAGAAVGASDNTRPGGNPVGGIMFGVGVVGFLAALITWVVLNSTCIRPSEITDTDITLVGVHRNFVDALEDERDRDEEEYRQRRDEERGRRRRDRDRDDEDDDRPRRSSKYDDDDDRPRRSRRDEYDD